MHALSCLQNFAPAGGSLESWPEPHCSLCVSTAPKLQLHGNVGAGIFWTCRSVLIPQTFGPTTFSVHVFCQLTALHFFTLNALQFGFY